ncbi:Protein N-methyltransferase NNT1 [Cyphellophora attinorum]|uniref:Protein N-methyltransferase NNT1 n=1 Tax=Cyphellophora attinorum TaxID=1664694 RepID=A0A0N1HCJ0_9EURO|nr:Protein N-methyltransferase NNT1 [Phialophora attinorum]KPI42434.1 Protein N-methyltransferase NNT1 [Phialophora attinorum]
MSLLTRISVPAPPSPEAEDIFSSALTTIFTDDAINSWGSPGSSITYRSPTFGPLELNVPVHPDEEQGRKLFAHYLWNAGVVAADAIESASSGDGDPIGQQNDLGNEEAPRVPGEWDTRYWDIRGRRVLELGAATALPSLICILCGASTCTITDHPSSPALTGGSIEKNVRSNLFIYQDPNDEHSPFQRRSRSEINIYGYAWGTDDFYDPKSYGKRVQPLPAASLPPTAALTPGGYPTVDKIIVADCLWMPSQHGNIVKTILDFLDPATSNNSTTTDAKTVPCALVVAGFHTGRAIVRDFFALATDHPSITTESSSPSSPPQDGPANGNINNDAHLKLATIFETDTSGNRRDWIWDDVREGEGKWEAKRWCVVGVLVRT